MQQRYEDIYLECRLMWIQIFVLYVFVAIFFDKFSIIFAFIFIHVKAIRNSQNLHSFCLFKQKFIIVWIQINDDAANAFRIFLKSIFRRHSLNKYWTNSVTHNLFWRRITWWKKNLRNIQSSKIFDRPYNTSLDISKKSFY